MIATVAEIKSILGLTDYTHDARIASILPAVENDALEYMNNYFINQDITLTGYYTITASAGVYRIVGSGMNQFVVNDVVLLSGSTVNDGCYVVKAISDGYIETVEPMRAQASATTMTVCLVSYPAGLKIYIAKMIGHQLFHSNDSGITSESIGNYSYSRSASSGAYPEGILSGLDKWRNISTKRGSITLKPYDLRGLV